MRRLAGRFSEIETELKATGNLYSLVVYTRHDDAPPAKSDRELLERLWSYLSRYAPNESPVADATGD